ncbi:hypothetical protein HDU76_005794 [Blyttiomyces sp. JEL0837]|nr:hypothetical protein HDU76_005794 [Blyttiomyces sp. JEL0837]
MSDQAVATTTPAFSKLVANGRLLAIGMVVLATAWVLTSPSKKKLITSTPSSPKSTKKRSSTTTGKKKRKSTTSNGTNNNLASSSSNASSPASTPTQQSSAMLSTPSSSTPTTATTTPAQSQSRSIPFSTSTATVNDGSSSSSHPSSPSRQLDSSNKSSTTTVKPPAASATSSTIEHDAERVARRQYFESSLRLAHSFADRELPLPLAYSNSTKKEIKKPAAKADVEVPEVVKSQEQQSQPQQPQSQQQQQQKTVKIVEEKKEEDVEQDGPSQAAQEYGRHFENSQRLKLIEKEFPFPLAYSDPKNKEVKREVVVTVNDLKKEAPVAKKNAKKEAVVVVKEVHVKKEVVVDDKPVKETAKAVAQSKEQPSSSLSQSYNVQAGSADDTAKTPMTMKEKMANINVSENVVILDLPAKKVQIVEDEVAPSNDETHNNNNNNVDNNKIQTITTDESHSTGSSSPISTVGSTGTGAETQKTLLQKKESKYNLNAQEFVPSGFGNGDVDFGGVSSWPNGNGNGVTKRRSSFFNVSASEFVPGGLAPSTFEAAEPSFQNGDNYYVDPNDIYNPYARETPQYFPAPYDNQVMDNNFIPQQPPVGQNLPGVPGGEVYENGAFIGAPNPQAPEFVPYMNQYGPNENGVMVNGVVGPDGMMVDQPGFARIDMVMGHGGHHGHNGGHHHGHNNHGYGGRNGQHGPANLSKKTSFRRDGRGRGGHGPGGGANANGHAAQNGGQGNEVNVNGGGGEKRSGRNRDRDGAGRGSSSGAPAPPTLADFIKVAEPKGLKKMASKKSMASITSNGNTEGVSVDGEGVGVDGDGVADESGVNGEVRSSRSGSPTGKKDKKVVGVVTPKCIYGTSCAISSCQYFHPSEVCKFYPNCRNEDSCRYIHGPKPVS